MFINIERICIESIIIVNIISDMSLDNEINCVVVLWKAVFCFQHYNAEHKQQNEIHENDYN